VGRYDRIAELAELAQPGLQIADLAAGQGRLTRALLTAAEPPARVHAVDIASNLDDDVLDDVRVRSVLADLNEPLPFPDGVLHRVVSLNAAEHLVDPAAHLVECHRVLAPGGLMVFAHSDWDTALFAGDDDALTRTLVNRFVQMVPTWAELSDGFMGRKLLGLAMDSPFEVVRVATWADCHRRFDEDSVGWKVARGVLASCRGDAALTAAATAWVQGLRKKAEAGRFLFSVTDVAVVLRRPA